MFQSVNGKPIVDANQFFRIVEAESQKQDLRSEIEMGQLPPNMETIKCHAGFDDQLINFKFDPRRGCKFSLLIANVYSHKVIVIDVKEGSAAGDYLKVYDHLIAINGQPVTDQVVVTQ